MVSQQLNPAQQVMLGHFGIAELSSRPLSGPEEAYLRMFSVNGLKCTYLDDGDNTAFNEFLYSVNTDTAATPPRKKRK
jgi:hypothetical protein